MKRKRSDRSQRCIYFGLCCGYIMPEIWLNYGKNEVALDIQAENLDERMSADSQILEDLKVITIS